MMFRRTAFAFLASLAASTTAFAQTTPDAQQPRQSTPPKAKDTGGPVDKLRDKGISLRFVWANDWAANVRGGERLGATNGGGAVGGADFDMGKLAGIEGGLMHVTFSRYYGHSVSANDIGILQKIQGYWYPKRQWELAQLSWEQEFKSSHLNVLAGRINATWQFGRSTYGCRFVSAPDCPFQLTNTSGGFTGFPYVNWGARVKYQPDARYVSIGAFELNPERRNNNGINWGLNNSNGVLIPVEVGYETSFANDPYPRHLKIGGWYNSAPFTDPELNTKGLHRGLVGGTARSYDGGRFGLYALADKVVYKPDPNSNTRNLAVFGSVTAPMDNAENYSMQATGGFLWTGLSKARPTDSVGLQATWFRFSRKAVGYEDDLIIKNKGDGHFKRDELMTELNYTYKLTPALRIMPNVQYIVHPDVLGNTVGVNRVPANAFVIGLRLMVYMGGPGST